jgi:ubiquinone/menaquinone biosynthesis C-methylase UbiE
MDFHHLTYPDEMFDLAYGSWVLHHVDCEKAGKELYRVLRPGGMAVFEENSDRNPLIRWVRRTLLGKPDGIQKRQFLFIRRYGSNDEYPLTDEEVDRLRQIFGTIEIRYTYFVFFGLIATHIWRHGTLKRITDWLDRAVIRLFPRLMEYSFCRYIVLEKPHPRP